MKSSGVSYILLMAGSLGTLPAHAQEPAFFHVTGNWIPRSDIDGSENLRQTPSTTDVDARVASFRTGFNVPIPLTKRAILMPGASYDFLSISQTGPLDGLAQVTELHALSTSLLFHYKISESWGFMASMAPTLSGDSIRLSGDHFRLGGSALASYEFSNRFSLGAGIVLSWQFGGLLPLPAIQLRFDILENLRLQALLPTWVELVWQPHERVEFGLSISIRGQVYALTSQPPSQEQGSCNDPRLSSSPETDALLCPDTFAYSRGEIGPTISIRLISSLWMTFHAGLPFLRRYEFLNSETSDMEGMDLAPHIMLQSALSFRLPSP